MPWLEETVSDQRVEMIELIACGMSVSDAAVLFSVSRKTASKWWNRWLAEGDDGLMDRSRARKTLSGLLISPEMTARILAINDVADSWGGRKIRARLLRDGVEGVPAASTITEVLRRNDRLGVSSRPQRDLVRFEAEHPNDLWQMDFKGDFGLADGGRCYPLTILDDHSRYALGIVAVADQRRETVREVLTGVFGDFGTPLRILCDHGPPWGASGHARYTRLGAWLLKHGIEVTHGRPKHPQTQGKDERFHRTYNQDVLKKQQVWDNHRQVQAATDRWLPIYNSYRPHEGIDMDLPADRYQPSPRPFDPDPPPPQYANDRNTRKVFSGYISWQRHQLRVGRAFNKELVHVTEHNDRIDIRYYKTIIRTHKKPT